jgi:Concanavalin A-like lectin/glucanases superfamily
MSLSHLSVAAIGHIVPSQQRSPAQPIMRIPPMKCILAVCILMVTVTTWTAVAQVAVNVAPALRITDTLQLNAPVSGSTNKNLIWKVNGVTGGNLTVGTISILGLYVAPVAVPNPATVTITAVSQADSTKSSSTLVTIVPCAPVPKGIVSWWTGERGPQDFSGNNRGTLQGGVTFVPAKVALGFNFDGSTGYVNVPDSSSLHSIAKTVSVEMWATPKTISASAAWGYLYARRNPLTSENFSFYVLADGTLGVLLRTSSSTTQTGSKFESVPGIVKFGKLQHFAATADTNTSIMRAYVNGSAVPLVNVFGPSSFSGTFSPVTHLYIGRRQDVNVEGLVGAGYFPGLIDEVSLYAVALTQSQIQNIVNAGVNGKCR